MWRKRVCIQLWEILDKSGVAYSLVVYAAQSGEACVQAVGKTAKRKRA